MVSLILPTYNEAENLPVLIPKIDKYLGKYTYEMIVVDDNSPDGTANIAKNLQKKGYPVRVILRKNERGLASATMRGFNEAKYPIVGVMDTDLQHDPKYLPKLLETIQNGCDMAVGSRYIKGSAFDGWPLQRKLISKLALLITKPLCKINDPLGQFYMVRKSAFNNVVFFKTGFRLSLEIMVKAHLEKVTEIPIVFGERYAGESKVLSVKSATTDLKLVFYLYVYKLRELLLGYESAVAYAKTIQSLATK